MKLYEALDKTSVHMMLDKVVGNTELFDEFITILGWDTDQLDSQALIRVDTFLRKFE